MFASLIVAGLPIVSAIIGLLAGIMGVFILSHSMFLASYDLSLCAMLGLAVGIDYALFIISRYRQEFADRGDIRDAIAAAMQTAGSSVIFAGSTVIVALLAMSVLRIPFLTSMGVASVLCVLTAVLTAILLVPAVLVVLGKHANGEKSNRVVQVVSSIRTRHPGGWGKFLTKNSLIVSVFCIVLLAVCSISFFHMNLGLPSDGSKSTTTTERRAYDLLTQAYGDGSQATLVVIASGSSTGNQTPGAVAAAQIKKLKDVAAVSQPTPSSSGKYYMVTVEPRTDANEPQTKQLVTDIRAQSAKDAHLDMLVTGSTAVNIDISDNLNAALPEFAILIVAFAFILLMILFRSLLIPFTAVIGFLLSIGATLGALVFIIQDGNLLGLFGLPTKSSILNFLPVVVIGILFGLAMDYEVFLVSRIREEHLKGLSDREAVIMGMKGSGGAVTAAGLIMASVFLGFVLASDPIVKSMGLALTFGIVFDAFVVRLTLIPAIISLFGKTAWYFPKWLDMLIPGARNSDTIVYEERPYDLPDPVM